MEVQDQHAHVLRHDALHVGDVPRFLCQSFRMHPAALVPAKIWAQIASGRKGARTR
jgi:hypothetical protein